MIPPKRLRHLVLILTIPMLAVILSLMQHTRAQADDQTSQPPAEQDCNETCLVCHGNPELTMTLTGGEALSLYISEDSLQESIHNQIGIGCRSCHTTIDGYPHPEVEYSTHRELSRTFYLACRTCHADNYNKTLDSMHAQAAEAGNLEAPICTDCHGTHDIRPPDQPRSHISDTCGRCHTTIFEQIGRASCRERV